MCARARGSGGERFARALFCSDFFFGRGGGRVNAAFFWEGRNCATRAFSKVLDIVGCVLFMKNGFVRAFWYLRKSCIIK